MSNGLCSLYKIVQQTRRHWPVVCTDYWHRYPRHYYMPLMDQHQQGMSQTQ